MLALLSAPRGRVSAARVAARLEERQAAEAYRITLRLPRAAEDATPERTQPAATPDARPPCR